MPKEKTLEEKLRFLQSQVRIGGRGSVRRKKKIVHQTITTDDKKLQGALKKLNVSTIPECDEVNMFKDDLSVIHFKRPRVQASTNASLFAISGHGDTKMVADMLPGLLPQLSDETRVQLRRVANLANGNAMDNNLAEDDDNIPMLVDNFEEASKTGINQETAYATIINDKSTELLLDDHDHLENRTNETIDTKGKGSNGNKKKQSPEKKKQNIIRKETAV